MKKVLIVGLGMMAGAWLELLDRKNVKVAGFDPNQKAMRQALKLNLIDEPAAGIEAASTMDVIVLAAPASVIIQTLQTLAVLPLKPGVLITDLGSTKTAILQAAAPLAAKGAVFVGGHPMCGSQLSGIEHADQVQLAGKPYFVVPAKGDAGVAELKSLLQDQVHLVQLTASEHDQLLASLSHLPHVAASALMNATPLSKTELHLAAGGFRDTTRIAAADPDMWTAVALTNRRALLDQLCEYQKVLREFKEALAAEDEPALKAFFQKAQHKRQEMR